jgi:hypothetical protein
MSFYKKTLNLSDHLVNLIKKHFEKVLQKPVAFYSSVRFAAAVPVHGIIIHDKTDTETPYRYAELINAAWPKSKLITTDGLGHNLKSPELIERVIHFIQTPISQRLMEVDKA